MARTLSELTAELLRKAPRFIADDPIGALILRGIARAVEVSDEALDAMTAELDRATASAAWLGYILTNLGQRGRDAWEDDGAVSDRAFLAPDGPTPGAIADAIGAAIPTGAGFEASVGEPRLATFDVDFYWDVPALILSEDTAPRWCVSVALPILEPHRSSDEALDVDFYLDLSYRDPLLSDLERDPYRRAARELDKRTPSAVGQNLQIVDTVEDAHLPLIWLTTSGFIL